MRVTKVHSERVFIPRVGPSDDKDNGKRMVLFDKVIVFRLSALMPLTMTAARGSKGR